MVVWKHYSSPQAIVYTFVNGMVHEGCYTSWLWACPEMEEAPVDCHVPGKHDDQPL
jgi:hypothetical protein